MQRRTLLIAWVSVFLLVSCAHKKEVHPPVAQVVPNDTNGASLALTVEKKADSARPEISDRDEKRVDDMPAVESETALARPVAAPSPDTQEPVRRSDYHKLTDIKKIWISLAFANVRVQTGASKKNSEARVKVFPPQGHTLKTDHCSAHFETDNGELRIVETKNIGKEIVSTISGALKLGTNSIPTEFECRYEVEIDSAESIDLGVQIVRGSLTAENWKKNIEVELDWGDVDVGNVGAVNINCGRCTVAGENVSGRFDFRIANGNVGVIGLQNAVVGETLGDLVLKWKNLPHNAKVQVKSRAGDVVLGLPKGVSVALDLKTPKGEVYNSAKIPTYSGGVPFDVAAEIGNIRLYRY